MKFQALASSSHGNAYIVDDGATRILIECGISFKRLQQRWQGGRKGKGDRTAARQVPAPNTFLARRIMTQTIISCDRRAEKWM